MIVGSGIKVGAGITIANDVTQALITSGLVLYLDAANSSSYSGSGSTWNDISGNNNNVTMQNSSSISYTSSGGGYFSTGTNGYFSRASSTTIPTGSSAYTLSVWVQFGSTWPSFGGFIGIGNGYGTTDAVNAFRTTATGGIVNYWWGNDASATFTPASNTAWINLVSTWDGTTRKMYQNATALTVSATSQTGLNVTSSYFTIGLTWPTQSEYLQGNIGQALVYNRALSQSEITNNFTVVRSRYGV
jgi:hypothetical protein